MLNRQPFASHPPRNEMRCDEQSEELGAGAQIPGRARFQQIVGLGGRPSSYRFRKLAYFYLLSHWLYHYNIGPLKA
jgi:hypothetical protein